MESIEISDLGVNLEEISKFNLKIRDSEFIEKYLDIDRKWQGFNMKLNGLTDETSELKSIQKWLQNKINDMENQTGN